MDRSLGAAGGRGRGQTLGLLLGGLGAAAAGFLIALGGEGRLGGPCDVAAGLLLLVGLGVAGAAAWYLVGRPRGAPLLALALLASCGRGETSGGTGEGSAPALVFGDDFSQGYPAGRWKSVLVNGAVNSPLVDEEWDGQPSLRILQRPEMACLRPPPPPSPGQPTCGFPTDPTPPLAGIESTVPIDLGRATTIAFDLGIPVTPCDQHSAVLLRYPYTVSLIDVASRRTLASLRYDGTITTYTIGDREAPYDHGNRLSMPRYVFDVDRDGLGTWSRDRAVMLPGVFVPVAECVMQILAPAAAGNPCDATIPRRDLRLDDVEVRQ